MDEFKTLALAYANAQRREDYAKQQFDTAHGECSAALTKLVEEARVNAEALPVAFKLDDATVVTIRCGDPCGDSVTVELVPCQ